MGAWSLVPALFKLREEFNKINPARDKGADGSIGDSSHNSSSDHTPDEDSRILRDHDTDDKNEVHALDIDSSGPWPGQGEQKQRFHAIIMRIIAGEKAKWLSATDMCRLNYVIWDRHIYDKDNDFRAVAYTLSDPHTNHAHFSNRYETRAESDTRAWGAYVPPAPIEETPVTQPLSIADEIIRITETAGRELFNPARPAGTEVPMDTVIQLGAIWAKRAYEQAEENAATLAQILAILTPEPPASQGS